MVSAGLKPEARFRLTQPRTLGLELGVACWQVLVIVKSKRPPRPRNRRSALP